MVLKILNFEIRHNSKCYMMLLKIVTSVVVFSIVSLIVPSVNRFDNLLFFYILDLRRCTFFHFNCCLCFLPPIENLTFSSIISFKSNSCVLKILLIAANGVFSPYFKKNAEKQNMELWSSSIVVSVGLFFVNDDGSLVGALLGSIAFLHFLTSSGARNIKSYLNP